MNAVYDSSVTCYLKVLNHYKQSWLIPCPYRFDCFRDVVNIMQT